MIGRCAQTQTNTHTNTQTHIERTHYLRHSLRSLGGDNYCGIARFIDCDSTRGFFVQYMHLCLTLAERYAIITLASFSRKLKTENCNCNFVTGGCTGQTVHSLQRYKQRVRSTAVTDECWLMTHNTRVSLFYSSTFTVSVAFTVDFVNGFVFFILHAESSNYTWRPST